MKSPQDLISNLLIKRKYDTVFIIGGGPSLKKIIPDPSIIKDNDIINCNNGYKLFPDALITHFVDKVWFEWHTSKEHNLFENVKGELTTSVGAAKEMYDPFVNRLIVFDRKSNETGLATEVNYLYGSNAGHQAINLAFHLKYKQICLIGFDLNTDTKQTHWHNDHKRVTDLSNFKSRMIPGFESIVPFQSKYDFQIFNLNRESALKCFEFADLKDFI